MNVSVNKSGEVYEINIDGVIKSVADSQSIKDAINSCDGTAPITLDITNSFSITSSVIGFLLKKVQADKRSIRINAHDSRLYDLFQTLNLTQTLNVHKAG